MKKRYLWTCIVPALALLVLVNVSPGAEKTRARRTANGVRTGGIEQQSVKPMLKDIFLDRQTDQEGPKIHIIDYSECAPTNGADVIVEGYAFDFPYNSDSGVASVTLFWDIATEEQDPPVDLDRVAQAVPMYCSSFGDNCVLWTARIRLNPEMIPPDPENWAIGFAAVATDNLGNGEHYYNEDDIRWISFCSE